MHADVTTRSSYPDVPSHGDGRFEGIGLGEPQFSSDGAPPRWRCGYGACSKCGCQGFEGNAGTCGNRGCGHAFQDHW